MRPQPKLRAMSSELTEVPACALGTNRIQQAVAEFHAAAGSTLGESPALRDVALRVRLIREESKESIDALNEGDLVAALGELCDLLYVVAGAFVAAGVDFAPLFEEIHAANMRKIGGPRRPDGKQQKPEGWQPADLAPLIEQQLAQAAGEL